MAGFQQAVNAIAGAYGTVAGRTGIYNELVGKNQELIKKTQAQNEELSKKNKELDKKNKELKDKNEELDLTNSNLITSLKLNLKQNELAQNLAKRLYANTRSRASKDKMLDVVYGKKTVTTAGPTVSTKEGGK